MAAPTDAKPKQGWLVTRVYEHLVEAGQGGLTRDQIARKIGRGHKPGVARANATKFLGQLMKAGGAEERDGRFFALPGWVYVNTGGKHPSPFKKLPEPVIGVDLSAEEHAEVMSHLGRKKKVVRINPSLMAFASDEEVRSARLYEARHNEDDWNVWLHAMFAPQFIKAEFAEHHAEFWEHVWQVQLGRPVRPFIAVWNRGGAKSTNVEMAAAALGALRKRKYCLYVCATQGSADDHVDSIAAMLGGELMEVAYPDAANPKVGKHGQAKAWRRNRLITENGYIVDALGLDVGARGRRVEEQRPDLIVLDDIDDQEDTPATTKKKTQKITRRVLPMSDANDRVVLGAQNIIHPESIFARLVSKGGLGEPERASFLATRIVSGPIKAVNNLEYEQRSQDDGTFRWVVTGGQPSWSGMPLASCQMMVDDYGLEAFLAECQHEEPDYHGSMFGHLDFTPNEGGVRVTELEFERVGVRTSKMLGELTCVWVDPSISKTDKSDSCGIVVDSLGRDGKIYRRHAWEQIATPIEALTRAIRYALEFNAAVVGVETDQGGIAWDTIYRALLPEVVKDWTAMMDGERPLRVPRFDWHKAGSAQQSKVERAARMGVDYDLGNIKHVGGYVVVLERGLRRFPDHKPYDVVDAAWHGWKWCMDHGAAPRNKLGMKARAPRGAVGEANSAALAG